MSAKELRGKAAGDLQSELIKQPLASSALRRRSSADHQSPTSVKQVADTTA